MYCVLFFIETIQLDYWKFSTMTGARVKSNFYAVTKCRENEAQRMPNMRNAIDILSKTDSCDTELQQNEKANMKSVLENRVTNETQSCSSSGTDNVPVVYIDGSCKSNGTKNSKAGIGIYWGDNHRWNVSNTLSQDQNDALTNNKTELRAATRALEIACEHKLDQLIINSDSKFVCVGNNGMDTQMAKEQLEKI